MNQIIRKLRKNKHFDELHTEQLETLIDNSMHLELTPKKTYSIDSLHTDTLCFVLSGTINVLRRHDDTQDTFKVGRIFEGECGQTSNTFKHSRKTINIKSNKKATCLFIPQKILHEQYSPDKKQQYISSFNEIAEHGSHKTSNNLFLSILFALCLYTLFIAQLHESARLSYTTTFTTLAITIIFTVLSIFYSKRIELKTSRHHKPRKTLKKALIQSTIISFGAITLITTIKFLLLKHGALPEKSQLFELYYHPELTTATKEQQHLNLWLISLLIYLFIVVPCQELLIRGFLQKMLFLLSPYKHANIYSIVTSNLIFSTFHLFISPMAALFTFAAGLLWGWMFYKHKTVLSPMLSHALTGGFTLFILGFDAGNWF